MIIDSHEHLMLPIEMQIEKLNQAGVDKAILFSTVPHPERAKNLAELRGEMNILYKVLAGANNKEANRKRMINLNYSRYLFQQCSMPYKHCVLTILLLHLISETISIQKRASSLL